MIKTTPLTGSPKQVAWADTIRLSVVDALEAQFPGDRLAAKKAVVLASLPTDAAWYIDHRNELIGAPRDITNGLVRLLTAADPTFPARVREAT